MGCSKDLFVIYKWPLRTENIVIKLNEIKGFKDLFSVFCRHLQENTNEGRPKVVKIFYGILLPFHIGTSFFSLMVPLRYRVPLFRFSKGPTRVSIFRFFRESRQGLIRVLVPGFLVFLGFHQGLTKVAGPDFPVCHYY